jgi:uncharacterized protein (TIGR02145 family)
MKQTNHKLSLLAALAVFAGACAEEGGVATGNEERLVTLSIAVPGPAETRAMAEGTERAVSEIDVLLFNAATDEFRYRAIGSSILDASVPGKTRKNFTVKLPMDEWTVVVLANARSLIETSRLTYPELAPATLAGGNTVTRANLLESLVTTLAAGSKWDESQPFPMWGYYKDEVAASTTLTVDENTASITDAIALTRAIARVDISMTETARDNLSLESARLYNYNRAGSIAPAVYTGSGSGLDGYDGEQWQYITGPPPGFKAMKPHVPASSLVPGPLLYDINNASNPAGTDVFACEREIYTFEAEAGTATLEDNTCLVIGGYYKESDAAGYSEKPTYYRVDFVESDGVTYLPLLRNHRYVVVIQSVAGEGYQTPEEAFDNAANIKVEILPWDDVTFGDIVFDGQNYISVSPAEFILYGESKIGNQLSIITDVASGWTITGTSLNSAPHEGFDAGWITVTGPLSGAAEVKSTVLFDVEKNDDPERAGYIHVRAGRLNFAVKVTQHTATGTKLWITDKDEKNVTTLLFPSIVDVVPDPQELRLHWIPANNVLYVSTSEAEAGKPLFAYHGDSDQPGTSISNLLGSKTLTIYPEALTASDLALNRVERSSKVVFTIGNSGVSETVYLRQIYYGISIDVATYYILGDGVQSFTVRSGTGWVISKVEDPDEILVASYRSSLNGQPVDPSTTGKAVNFELVHDNSKDGKIATLTLHDPTDLTADLSVIIKGIKCGLGGTAVSKHIGNNDYLTHAYAGKCWMVQNSNEGTQAEATSYKKEESYAGKGYYYAWEHTKIPDNACPAGWRLCTDAEATALVTAVNKDKTGVGKWWLDKDHDAFGGAYYTVVHGSPGWKEWGTYGYWWGGENLSIRFYRSTFHTVQYGNNHVLYCLTVRCVQD